MHGETVKKVLRYFKMHSFYELICNVYGVWSLGSQEIRRILWNPKINYHVHKSLTLAVRVS
jgi:hypothetical protein